MNLKHALALLLPLVVIGCSASPDQDDAKLRQVLSKPPAPPGAPPASGAALGSAANHPKPAFTPGMKKPGVPGGPPVGQ
jgi:hypothetical protein